MINWACGEAGSNPGPGVQDVSGVRDSYDVVVVGAGPAGTSAARFCAREGLSTLCIEEHGTIGHPVQCAGLLSTAAFRECGVSDRCVLQTVRGARIVSSLGGSFSFDAGVVKAYVVDRGVLDREMAVHAAQDGVDFLLKTSATGFSGGGVETAGVSGKRRIRCRVLIAADGPRSLFSRILGLQRAKYFLGGRQVDCARHVEPGLVEIHPDAAPDFFGWVIPAGKGYARIGLCSRTDVRDRFERFISPVQGPIISEVTGTIPLGPMPQTYARSVLFVGDAAGLAKPTSGGGVYTGIRSARHAALVAASAVRTGDFSKGTMARYQEAWKADFGRELALGLRFLSIRSHLGPADIGRICRVMDDPDVMDIIIREGDMDRPARVLMSLFRERKMARLYGVFIRALAVDIVHRR
jgi:geranylgeranyl reductase family protein